MEMVRAVSRPGALLTCCSMIDTYRAQGVVGGHAYTVLGLQEVSGLPRLVRVRNPWGNSFEWRVGSCCCSCL